MTVDEQIAAAIDAAEVNAQWLLDTAHSNTINSVARQVVRAAPVDRKRLADHRACSYLVEFRGCDVKPQLAEAYGIVLAQQCSCQGDECGEGEAAGCCYCAHMDIYQPCPAEPAPAPEPSDNDIAAAEDTRP